MLLEQYQQWLVVDRGLAAPTVHRYTKTARRFLTDCSTAGVTPSALTGVEVNAFLIAECGRVSAGSAKGRVAELRSLLRFLFAAQVIMVRLGTAVPPVGGWRLATVPPTMTTADVQALLDQCDRSSDVGARNFAMLWKRTCWRVERLPAWGKTLRARTVATPKVHVIDSGLAARLMRLTPTKLSTLDATAQTEFGNLLETFVVGELRKHLSWSDQSVAVGHWRTHDEDEVDLVLEFGDGRVLGFEIKASERVTGEDLRGLRKLRDALGGRFLAGVAFTLGSRSYSYAHRLHVLPVDRLWVPVSAEGSGR